MGAAPDDEASAPPAGETARGGDRPSAPGASGSGVSGPRLARTMEGATLSALLVLFLAAADKGKKATSASSTVLNLVGELQEHRAAAPGDIEMRASIIARLSAALSGLRRDLD